MRTTAHLILCLLGCLVLSPWLEGAKTKDCPKDWLRYQGSCYGFFPQKITWAEAESATHPIATLWKDPRTSSTAEI
ncbi:dromaiocalcin-1-like [Alligator mississippiensis]|uniref:dromaiocalcin-1-like n=1 Tax=Alligator mississippiensis TaxID=8496 RepID=UPI00287731BC|nr:dromaiocalcin-1-like [Alligator mississippiensis]